MFYETTYVDAKREKRKEYLMNRDGFSLLVMGFTGEKALEFKLNYIEAFNQMEEMLKERNNEHHRAEVERIKGIGIRRALTDTICKLVADTPHKKFAYANYTKLIYKVTFGLTMDELRSKYGATTKESVRDLMSAEDLLAVQNKEFLVSGLIAEGWSYKEIRSFMETHCHKADDFHIDVAESIENKAAKELC